MFCARSGPVKSEQKHTTKIFAGFQDHSLLLTQTGHFSKDIDDIISRFFIVVWANSQIAYVVKGNRITYWVEDMNFIF